MKQREIDARLVRKYHDIRQRRDNEHGVEGDTIMELADLIGATKWHLTQAGKALRLAGHVPFCGNGSGTDMKAWHANLRQKRNTFNMLKARLARLEKELI